MGLMSVWKGHKTRKRVFTRGDSWTEEEDDQLKSLYGKGLTNGEIGEIMSRSSGAVKMRIVTLGLKGREYVRVFSAEDTEKLSKIFKKHTDQELADIFGVDHEQIRRKRNREGFNRVEKRKWTKEEVDLIKNIKKGESVSRVSKKINRTKLAIIEKLHRIRRENEARNRVSTKSE